mmetsp:Transcript_48639/g.135925  ORF Transcript_48639/g.135925 Transcript_48639/m.135925 type:complete len:423 (+) Transcript_48639:641-1909(+)
MFLSSSTGRPVTKAASSNSDICSSLAPGSPLASTSTLVEGAAASAFAILAFDAGSIFNCNTFLRFVVSGAVGAATAGGAGGAAVVSVEGGAAGCLVPMSTCAPTFAFNRAASASGSKARGGACSESALVAFNRAASASGSKARDAAAAGSACPLRCATSASGLNVLSLLTPAWSFVLTRGAAAAAANNVWASGNTGLAPATAPATAPTASNVWASVDSGLPGGNTTLGASAGFAGGGGATLGAPLEGRSRFGLGLIISPFIAASNCPTPLQRPVPVSMPGMHFMTMAEGFKVPEIWWSSLSNTSCLSISGKPSPSSLPPRLYRSLRMRRPRSYNASQRESFDKASNECFLKNSLRVLPALKFFGAFPMNVPSSMSCSFRASTAFGSRAFLKESQSFNMSLSKVSARFIIIMCSRAIFLWSMS